MLSSRLGRFLAPWLAYAALSGVGGILISIMGALVLHLFDVNSPSRFSDLNLFEVVQSILGVMAYGFIGGFVTGLTSGLIGGKPGYWWSFASAFGLSILFPSIFLESLSFAFLAFGALLPNWLLADEPGLPAWLISLLRWLRGTWIYRPPSMARLAGIFLPLMLGSVAEVVVVAPVYASHKNYAARWGSWTVWWKSSDGFARHTEHKSSCYSNLKEIMLGLRQYTQDYDERYPPKPLYPEGGAPAVLQPYLKSTLIYQCPSEFYYPEYETPPRTIKFNSGDFTDYWFNARTYGLSETSFDNSPVTAIWGDGNTGAGEGKADYALTDIPPNFGPASRHAYPEPGANYAFADGEVKWLKVNRVSNTSPANKGVPTMRP